MGALLVHRGRYAFADSGHAHELSGAHTYLKWLGPVAAVVLFLAVLELLARLGRSGGSTSALPRARCLWPMSTLTLLAIFGLQEVLEAWSAQGHPPQLHDVLGGGGWTAVPFAVAVGAVIALLLRAAERVVRWAIERAARLVPRRAAAVRTPRPPVLAAPCSVLARRLAGRAPPVLASSR